MRQAQGDLKGASDAFAAELEMLQQVVSKDETNAKWKHDLAICWQHLGDLHRQQSDLERAAGAYASSLAILQQLVGKDPSNTGWQHDLALGWQSIGDLRQTDLEQLSG